METGNLEYIYFVTYNYMQKYQIKDTRNEKCLLGSSSPSLCSHRTVSYVSFPVLFKAFVQKSPKINLLLLQEHFHSQIDEIFLSIQPNFPSLPIPINFILLLLASPYIISSLLRACYKQQQAFQVFFPYTLQVFISHVSQDSIFNPLQHFCSLLSASQFA